MEIPSFFYMQDIIERRNRLFEIGNRIPEYKELKEMGCKFYDDSFYVMMNPVRNLN